MKSIRRQIFPVSPPLVFHYVGGKTAGRSIAAMNQSSVFGAQLAPGYQPPDQSLLQWKARGINQDRGINHDDFRSRGETKGRGLAFLVLKSFS